MEPWKRFLQKNKEHKDVLRTYVKLRKLFQSYDWSESDLESPPYYSREMMRLRDKLRSQYMGLLNRLHDFGFDIDEDSFGVYLKEYMSRIDKLTPLKDGNNERGNQGNEDIE